MSDKLDAWSLAILDDDGQPLWHIADTNPPQYAPDERLTALWHKGEQLRMKHAQAIKLAVEALEAEIDRLQIDADLYDKSPIVTLGATEDFRTPRRAAASKRRADCQAAIETLQQPEQLAMELEVA